MRHTDVAANMPVPRSMPVPGCKGAQRETVRNTHGVNHHQFQIAFKANFVLRGIFDSWALAGWCSGCLRIATWSGSTFRVT